MSGSVFSAQTISPVPTNEIDTLAVNVLQDTTVVDTIAQDTFYRSLRILPDMTMPYNQNAFKFKYDAFKEQMKNPWIADALREILFR